MMREMARKGIFESKLGLMKRGAIWQNIADDFEQLRRIYCNGAKS